MELPDLSLCLLSMVLLLSQGIRVSSISFELHSTNTKCVSEDMNTDVLVLGDYHVVDSNLPNRTHAKIFAKEPGQNYLVLVRSMGKRKQDEDVFRS